MMHYFPSDKNNISTNTQKRYLYLQNIHTACTFFHKNFLFLTVGYILLGLLFILHFESVDLSLGQPLLMPLARLLGSGPTSLSLVRHSFIHLEITLDTLIFTG